MGITPLTPIDTTETAPVSEPIPTYTKQAKTPVPTSPDLYDPKMNFSSYILNLNKLNTGIEQNQALTGYQSSSAIRGSIMEGALAAGSEQAIEDVRSAKEQALQEKSFALQEKSLKVQKKAANKDSGGGCCFIFIEAYDGLLPIVRRYRDEHVTEQGKRGYYRLADKIVPWMKKSVMFKWAIRICMTGPMLSYGKWYYDEGKAGFIFWPITKLWIGVYNLLGIKKPYTRKNGEVI